jgi:hypothetical protein
MVFGNVPQEKKGELVVNVSGDSLGRVVEGGCVNTINNTI